MRSLIHSNVFAATASNLHVSELHYLEVSSCVRHDFLTLPRCPISQRRPYIPSKPKPSPFQENEYSQTSQQQLFQTHPPGTQVSKQERSTLSPRILRPISLNDIGRFGYIIHNGAKYTAKCLAKRSSFVLQVVVLTTSSLGRQRESKFCCIGHLEERKCRA